MPSRYFRVPLSEIAYVRMIVEAFDGLRAKDLDSLHKLLGKVKQHQLDINQRMGDVGE